MINVTPFGKAAGETSLSATELASRVAEVLSASGAASWAFKPGAPAPGFTLYDSDGSPVSLNGALTAGPVVVTFHGGLWCPSSADDLQALEATLPDYAQYGASLLAISPQTQRHNLSARDRAGTSFPLLADRETALRQPSASSWNCRRL
jgi:peroxiredoxin